jgi:glycosyltransferase involved in cell wall biosynthesis
MMSDDTTVWFVPMVPQGNPYQPSLAAELRKFGCTVGDENANLRTILWRVLSKRPSKPIVHLHWIPNFASRKFGWVKAISYVCQLWLLRRMRVPIVWTVHNLYHHESQGIRLQHWTGRRIFRLSSRVIAHSESAKRSIADEFSNGATERIVTIPHGTYVGLYSDQITRSAARSQLGLAEDVVAFLFFGQIRPYKGVEGLIESFRSLSGERIRLLVAGRPLDDQIAARIRQSAEGDPRISLYPRFIPDEEIQVYMNAADWVVFPYIEILTSGAVVLAMSFGCACIAPRIAGMPELLGEDGGILYPPDRPDGLLNALAQAKNLSQAVCDMGNRNRRAAARLGWERIAAETKAVYDAARNERM